MGGWHERYVFLTVKRRPVGISHRFYTLAVQDYLWKKER
jgi:hypothetical protein